LAVPITALITSRSTPIDGELPPAEVVRRFEGLKELRACMWEGFEDQADERASRAVRQSMEIHLADLRENLVALVEKEEDAEGRKNGYVAPKIALE
jgi:hypothetical protein